MNSSPSTLILPVENQVRELDAKLLLACVAAERGFPVILGSRPYVDFAMPEIPRGVFVAKSMRSRSALMFNIIRALGNDIVAWDEESLVRFNSSEYYSWRFSENTFAPLKHLFAWGRDDAEMFAAYPGCRGLPVHITGNPRIDLLRKEVRGYFEPAVADLRNRFGDFILINTNFAFVNAFVQKLNLVLEAGAAGKPVVSRTGQGMSLEFAQGMFRHQQAIYDNFARLLPLLSGWFPDYQIVLRPHPSENHAVWENIAASLTNVHIVHKGNVVPWLMAARALLHNGCTTAVEAAVLGTPAVTYQPVTAQCYDYALPNSLSHVARTAAEVQDLLRGIVTKKIGSLNQDSLDATFGRHLEAASGRLAADRAIDVLVQQGYLERPPQHNAMSRRLLARLICRARTGIKKINQYRPGHWNSAEYHSHRFPEISAVEVNSRIHRFRTLLGRFEKVRARMSAPYMFSIDNLSASSRQP